MYNSYFDIKIRNRGFEYYKEGRVTNIVENKNILNAMVTGNNLYSVEVVFDEKDDSIIKSAKCNCQYFIDRNEYCKHIYAAIMSVKYDKEKEEKELKENQENILQVKIECEKYIKMCKNIFKRQKRQLLFSSKYLTKNKYEHYTKYYNIYLKSFNTDIELVHKDSIYISFYNKRLESLKNLYSTITDDLNSLTKDIKEGKQQVKQEKVQTRPFGLIGALFGLVSALMPEKEINDLKVGDHVRVHGADGEIQDIYKDGDIYQYDVLYEREEPIDGDDEDEDVFFRDEIEKDDE